MVRLETVKSANLELVKKQSLVAVFSGGTCGIGQYTLEALAKAHASTGRGLRVYLVGRNEKAAEKIVADCRQLCPTGTFTFVKAHDLSLLKNVDVVCNKIIELEQKEEQPRIDILVMTHACPPFKHQVNSDGLDMLFSLLYYSRMRMTTKLLPLLLESSMPAHVVSVYGAGFEGKILKDDFSLQKPGNYSLGMVRSHVAYMKTAYMELLAKQHPGKLSLTHVFPSLVITPTFNDPELPTWFRLIWKCGGGFLARLYALSPDESGQRTLFLATTRYPARYSNTTGNTQPDVQQTAMGTDGTYGSGAYAVNYDGEAVSVAKAYQMRDKGELSTLIVEHTHRAFDQIEKGQVFKG